MLNGKYKTEENGVGKRLDAFLLELCPTSTRSFVREAIQGGRVTLNGRIAPKGVKLRLGDEVIVRELLEQCDNHVVADSDVVPEIVYDSDGIIGVNKPAGISVQPLSPLERGTLMNGMVALYPELASVGDEPLIAGALHRIDGGTSGLVLVARNQELFTAMRRLFSERRVEKRYLALVEGQVKKGGRVSCCLSHDPSLSYCRMVDSRTVVNPRDSLLAETYYTPMRTVGRNTLLEVTIRTGITHQIRAQLAIAGYPIVGDSLYGAKEAKGVGFCLHSYSAAFTHPFSGDKITIVTPLPHFASEP